MNPNQTNTILGGNMSRRKLLKRAGAIGAMALGAGSVLKVQAVDSADVVWKITNTWVQGVGGIPFPGTEAQALATATAFATANATSSTLFTENGVNAAYSFMQGNNIQYYYEAPGNLGEKVTKILTFVTNPIAYHVVGEDAWRAAVHCTGTKWIYKPWS